MPPRIWGLTGIPSQPIDIVDIDACLSTALLLSPLHAGEVSLRVYTADDGPRVNALQIPPAIPSLG